MTIERTKTITILGLGNVLIGDDGFGVRFVTWFSDRYILPDTVSVVDGGTAGLGLLDIVTGADHLIVIDAIRIDDTPGSIYRFTGEDMSLYLPAPTSVHEVEFLDVLAMADLLNQRPPVTFITVVPEKYDTMEVRISDIMYERFADVERLLLEELAALSAGPVRRTVCTS
jgi:hydrogenase maturation protease